MHWQFLLVTSQMSTAVCLGKDLQVYFNVLLTVAGEQTQSKQNDASLNDFVSDLPLACFSAPQGAE